MEGGSSLNHTTPITEQQQGMATESVDEIPLHLHELQRDTQHQLEQVREENLHLRRCEHVQHLALEEAKVCTPTHFFYSCIKSPC